VGGYDGYLSSFADSVRNFGQAVVIGFGHEMKRHLVLMGLRTPAGFDVRGSVATYRDAVPQPER
jgi:hypothetical protein